MNRIFEFDNKKEVKLSVEGFDRAPILMGSEYSNGATELENLNNFHGCSLFVKSVNVKDENNEVVGLKTYYTVVQAKEKKYDNKIIDVIERKDNSKLVVEVCLGVNEYKRFIILEYPSSENMLSITKQLPSEISKIFSSKEKKSKSDTETPVNNINITLYDNNGFEMTKSVLISEIADYIISVRVIDTIDNSVKEVVSQRAQDMFKRIKESGKNNVEVISNFTSSVMKMISVKKNDVVEKNDTL